jgi:hypothetical protein
MANNTMQILRSNTTATPASLLPGQLAFSSNSNILFIGSPATGTPVIAIGGQYNPGILTANQALVANSTSGLNQIIVANATINSFLSANGSQGTAGQILTSSGSTSNLYWSTPTLGVAGTNGQLQFNNSGSLNGTNGMSYNITTNTLSIVGNSTLYTAIGPYQTYSVQGGYSANINAIQAIYSTTVANSLLSATQLFLRDGYGNSANVIPTSISVSNTAGITIVTGASITISNSTAQAVGISASGIQVGPNVALSTSSIVIGNSTIYKTSNSTIDAFVSPGVNSFINSTAFFTGNSTTYSIGNATVDTWVTPTSSLTTNASAIFIGNATVNATVNSTVFTGTSNNANYLAGVSSASYVNTAQISGLVSGLTANNAYYLGGVSSAVYVTTFGSTSFTGNNAFGGTNTYFSSNIVIQSASISALNANLVVGSLNVSGNLIVSGTVENINTSELLVNSNIIELSSSHTSVDTVDSGWFAPGGNSTATWYSVFGRITSQSTNNNPYFMILGTKTNPNTSTTFDISSANSTTGTLQAYLAPYGVGGQFTVNSTSIRIVANSTVNVNISANTLILSQALQATYGGTGLTSYASGDLLYSASVNPNSLTNLNIGSNGTVLQVTNNLPSWGVLDGGTF